MWRFYFLLFFTPKWFFLSSCHEKGIQGFSGQVEREVPFVVCFIFWSWWDWHGIWGFLWSIDERMWVRVLQESVGYCSNCGLRRLAPHRWCWLHRRGWRCFHSGAHQRAYQIQRLPGTSHLFWMGTTTIVLKFLNRDALLTMSDPVTEQGLERDLQKDVVKWSKLGDWRPTPVTCAAKNIRKWTPWKYVSKT